MRFTAISRSQSSMVVSMTSASTRMPALLTRTSTPAGISHDPFHQLPDRIGIGDVADGFDDLARRFVEREVHAVDPVSEVQELPGD